MNFSKIAPDDTFIGQYMLAMSEVETSAAYDFWAACWALGTVVGRDVYIPRPHAPVHMNWYVMLLAESGVTRKSTAVRQARDIVSCALGMDHLIEGKCTPEYLFNYLIPHPHCAIAVSELATFLGRESYIVELPALLTDLYDCPKEKRGGSISKGEQIISNAFVTFISASTPTWLRTSVNPTVVEGGFTSRCLFVHDEKPKKRIAWPTQAVTRVTELADQLKSTCQRAQEVGHIELMPSGMKAFERWYRRRDVSSVMPFVASFNSREDAHVLRMAATLCINDGTLAIEKRHIDAGIKLITRVKADATKVFSDTGSAIKISQGISRLIQLLLEAGPVGVLHGRLYSSVRYYMRSDEFNIVVTSMHQLNMLTKMVENRSGSGRPSVRYARGPNLTNNRAIEELMQTFV